MTEEEYQKEIKMDKVLFNDGLIDQSTSNFYIHPDEVFLKHINSVSDDKDSNAIRVVRIAANPTNGGTDVYLSDGTIEDGYGQKKGHW